MRRRAIGSGDCRSQIQYRKYVTAIDFVRIPAFDVDIATFRTTSITTGSILDHSRTDLRASPRK
jgi:hypothetical protein